MVGSPLRVVLDREPGWFEGEEEEYQRHPHRTSPVMRNEWMDDRPIQSQDVRDRLFQISAARNTEGSAKLSLRIRDNLNKVIEDPSVRFRAIRVTSRAAAMGLGDVDVDPWRIAEQFVAALRLLITVDVGTRIAAELSASSDPRTWNAHLETLLADIEASPVPHAEARRLSSLLGKDMLSGMVGVTTQTLETIASGAATSDRAAARLHYIALIVADLRTAYNDYGVRRWFTRSRKRLAGRSPYEVLSGGAWHPEDQVPGRVKLLASALFGAPAT